MSEFLNRRTEIATLWRVTGNDGFGDQLYAAPVTVRVRWEERQVVFTNSAGQDEMASAIAWMPYDVFEGEVIALGSHATSDPWDGSVPTAREIQGFIKVRHLLNPTYERRAFLGARRLR